MEEVKIKPRILAVDDSRVMRRAMSKILSKEYDVIETENGADAWNILLNDDSIQVVFTDLNMPFLDGYGLLERIRSSDDPKINETPVIIITGKDDDDDAKQEALDKGANDFITKPFDSIQLQARAKAQIAFRQTNNKLTETSDQLERQATIDEITGLGGQRYFCKVGDETLSYASRHNGQFILVRLDIDEFNNLFIKHKKVIMDKVLQSIGEKLTQLVRQEDTIARIGVSKFALILKETNMKAVIALTSRIREEVQAMTFKLSNDNELIKLTISAGLHEPELNSEKTFKEMIADTENYLNDAIAAGGNQIISHTHVKLTSNNDEIEDINITEVLKQIEGNHHEELSSKVNSILHHITPLLTFLSLHARSELQEVLRKLNNK